MYMEMGFQWVHKILYFFTRNVIWLSASFILDLYFLMNSMRLRQ